MKHTFRKVNPNSQRWRTPKEYSVRLSCISYRDKSVEPTFELDGIGPAGAVLDLRFHADDPPVVKRFAASLFILMHPEFTCPKCGGDGTLPKIAHAPVECDLCKGVGVRAPKESP